MTPTVTNPYLKPSYSAKKPLPPPKPKKESSWLWMTLISGVLSGLILFGIGWYFSLPNHQKQGVMHNILSGDGLSGLVGLNQSKTILVMGVDMPPLHSKDEYAAVRTDTMMLVRLDPHHKKVNIVSIPRDSKVYVAGGHGIDKINAAFTYGGPETAVATVEQTLGLNINNYIVVNLSGVKDFVNALGGVDVYVEKPMHYVDHTAKLNISFEPGMHHMDGPQAEEFLRFRHDALGDIGRIRRQQQFIAGITRKLKDPSIILHLQPLLSASNQHIKTDMSTGDLIGLAVFGKDLGRSDFQVATLPGHPSSHSSVSYWIIEPTEAEQVLNRMIVGLSPDETGSKMLNPTVGIIYTANHKPELAAYREQLTKLGFTVGCTQTLLHSTTKFITHNTNLPKSEDEKLIASDPALKNAQQIFLPHGTTYEVNSCGSTDYTIVLGDDTRSTP